MPPQELPQPRAVIEKNAGPGGTWWDVQKAGFAYRDLCPSDKRGVYAVITDEGRERYQSARATYAEVLSSALNVFAADPELGPTVQALRTALSGR